MKTQVCTKCGKRKYITEFNKNKRNTKKGIGSRCKVCLAEISKEYRKTHKDIRDRREYRKKYYEANKGKFKEWNKQWMKDNRERREQYMKEWRDKNPSQKIAHYCRSRIKNAIKKGYKAADTLSLTGCKSWDEVKQHLEKQFTKGMTWDNHGEWHIDHIKPCASFDLTKESEQKKCFHYSNLQPLWAKENLRKSDRY